MGALDLRRTQPRDRGAINPETIPKTAPPAAWSDPTSNGPATNTSRSGGWVRLGSSDPSAPPRIHLAHLTAAADVERMVDAVIEARRLAHSEPVLAIAAGPELTPGSACPTDDRGALAAWLRTAVSTFHHPVGTCAMGPDPALGAVCDAHGSVHGVEALTVADASIMPTIPTANTNIPTIMVAEHIARWLQRL